MINKFYYLALFLLFTYTGSSQSIFLNEITDPYPSSVNPYTNNQFVDANITVSGIGRGINITAPTAAQTANMYAAQSWSTVFHPDDYFEFVLTPNPGYKIDFLNFIYDGKPINYYGTPPDNILIRSSLDGFTSNIGTPTLTGTNTIDLSGSAYQNITSSITFRVYAWGGVPAGIFGIERFEFNGAVNPIPCYGATTSTWDGNSWDNGLPNDTNTIAIIDGNYNTFNGGDQNSFTACSLTVNSGYSLIIADNDFIDIENDITVDGSIIVNPKGAVVQRNNNALVNKSGSITVEKETAPMNVWYEYTYWSSPVENETVGNALSASDTSRRFVFNGANFLDAKMETNNDNSEADGQDDIDDNGDDWEWVSGSETMIAGVGYAATHSEEAFIIPPGPPSPIQFKYTFSGAFNNGIITVPIYRNDSETNDINWNLVGNPYPSAISADLFLGTNTNIATDIPHSGVTDGAIFIWSQNTAPSGNNNGNEQVNFDTSDYAVINVIGETAGGDFETPSRHIPSGQGFFISYANNASVETNNGDIKQGTVTFNNSMRVTTNNDLFFRVSDKKKNDNTNKLWIDLTSDNGVFNQTLVAYANGATNDYDGMAYDTPKNLAANASVSLYSIIDNNTKKYVIQGKDPLSLDENEVVKIGFKTSIDVPTIYAISLPQIEGDFLNSNPIVLKDKLLNTSHDLKNGDYNFTSEVGEFNERFEILFNNASLSNDEFLTAEKTLSIFEHRNGDVQFKLNSNSLQMNNIKIIDLQGRTIYNFNVDKNDSTHQLSALSQAPYIARVTLNNNQTIIKKAIKKY
jgi:hypothetical protein